MSNSVNLPLSADSSDRVIPDWIHVLPAGSFPAGGGTRIFTNNEPEKLIAASMARGRGKLVLDENHSTDLAHGKQAPAAGWIVEMQARPDGIWGRVEWTKYGEKLMGDRAYRAISPVILTDIKTGAVTSIERASLTNAPDLKTLKTLHSMSGVFPEQENIVDNMKLSELRVKLGLPPDAGIASIEAALAAARSAKSLHSSVAALVGADSSAGAEVLIAGISARREELSLHSQQIAALTQERDALKTAQAQQAAEHFVAEAGRKKIITEKMAENLKTLHCSNPEVAQSIVDGLADAPAGQGLSLHGASGETNFQTGNSSDMRSVDRAFGLTGDDLKSGGLI